MNKFCSKKILMVITVLVALLSVSCKGKGLASRYKTKTIGCDTLFSKVDILVPVFKAEALSELNQAVYTEMDSEFRAFNREMKQLWLDWDAANEAFYPGTTTDPFEMMVKDIEISEDENTIVISLKGYKRDGYSRNRDWSKIVSYTKATGEIQFKVNEELISLE